MNKLSIIVPCYNEEEVVSLFYRETCRAVTAIPDLDYEFIFIDDGSKDHTLDILRLLCYQDKNCHYISFSRNFGKEAAMYAGLEQSSGDYCVIMDADLQHPPTPISPFPNAPCPYVPCCQPGRVWLLCRETHWKGRGQRASEHAF